MAYDPQHYRGCEGCGRHSYECDCAECKRDMWHSLRGLAIFVAIVAGLLAWAATHLTWVRLFFLL